MQGFLPVIRCTYVNCSERMKTGITIVGTCNAATYVLLDASEFVCRRAYNNSRCCYDEALKLGDDASVNIHDVIYTFFVFCVKAVNSK